MWQFEICVREGAPGWADDDEYTSEWYDSFESCFMAYVNFNPYTWWNNLRYVQREVIRYKNKDMCTTNTVHGGRLCYNKNTILNDLGITEREYLKYLSM